VNAFSKTGFAIAALLLLAGRDGFAQFDPRRGDIDGPFVRTEGGVLYNEDTVRTARETVSHSTGTPTWTNEPGFEKDVFTFARVIFKSRTNGGRRFMRGGFLGWSNDYPDSDLNLSWRLQELTALRTDPDGRVLKLTNPDLFDYPLIYMVKPGRMELRDDEAPILRKYLEAGGALWADDFWGEPEWENFEREMQRVLPGRHWQELPMEHPLFHCVFDLKPPKENLQVPPIHIFERTGSSSRNGAETREVHMRAWFDDKGRIMILATHNTDNGDGWEREGEDPEYFQKFSEGRAYPLAFNVIFYLMTH
jgi:hypothetical protein